MGNAPISGADQQSYLATASGNYAVELTLGNCTVVSELLFRGKHEHSSSRCSASRSGPTPPTGGQVSGIGRPGPAPWLRMPLGQEVPTQRTGARLVLTDATPGLYFLCRS